jgi:hypothetical protein
MAHYTHYTIPTTATGGDHGRWWATALDIANLNHNAKESQPEDQGGLRVEATMPRNLNPKTRGGVNLCYAPQ